MSSDQVPAQHGHSKACCNVPPVVAEDYKSKGSYETVGGLKTYVTGSASASHGILFVADIFGFKSQSLQGADILGSCTTNTTSGKIAVNGSPPPYLVLVPDLFDDKPCPIEVFPPDTVDKKQQLGQFFARHSPQPTAERLVEYLAAAKHQFPRLQHWDIIGFCWGGKVACLTSKALPDAFGHVASCHPAMVDPTDAPPVPLCLLASKDEDASAVAELAKTHHGGASHIETFSDSSHGWMAARADLSDKQQREAYLRGYQTVVNFFCLTDRDNK